MTWNTAALDDILHLNKSYIPILDHVEYKYAALHPYPHSLSLRGQKRGRDFRGKRHQVIQTGQFVISRLRTQQHFWGIVPHNLDDAIVHRSYLCFDIHKEINPTYFAAYIGTPEFRHSVSKSRNRHGRLDLRRFSRITMPLPTAAEQNAIAEIWQNIANTFAHTNEMYASISALKAGVGDELLHKIRPQHARLLGDWISISSDFTTGHALYIQNDGQLAKGDDPSQDIRFGIDAKADLDNQFLYYYLEHSKHHFQKNLQATGFNAEDAIRALPIDVPTVYEQRKIVAIMQQHEDALHKLRTELHELRHLTGGMMQLIFSGKLPYNETLGLMQNLWGQSQ